MGFNDEIELYANNLRYSKIRKYSEKGIDKALVTIKERNAAEDFTGWTWAEVCEEFINAVNRASPTRSKPYQSGKRMSK